MKENNRLTYLVLPILLFIVTSILVVLGLKYAWFGEAREGIMKFCEHARGGYVKQPANSFSNLAFSIVGLIIAWLGYNNSFTKNNLFTSSPNYLLLWSCSLIILGAGSFAMHASNAHWGGLADLFGMFLLSSFAFAYALMRLLKSSHGFFLVLFLGSLFLSTYVYLSPFNNIGWFMSPAEICFISFALIGMFVELYMVHFKDMNIDSKKGYTAIALIVVAFTIWNLSVNQDSWWCNPHSLIQGHAFWHILDAIATFFIFRYYVSEEIR